MDTAALGAWFAHNKAEALMVGGLAVAGLALAQRRKAAAAAPAAAAGLVPGTIPAAAVVPAAATGGSFDSSSFDAYNALQDEIGTLARQGEAARQTGAGGSGVSAAVSAPVASSLFSPQFNGNYVRFAQGGLGEVESDGSILSMTLPQWSQAYKVAGSSGVNVQQLQAATAPTNFTTEANLLAKAKAAGGTAGA